MLRRSIRSRALRSLIAIGACTCIVTSLARAQDPTATPDVQAAARAFQAAQRAQLEGDSAGAARLYELANSIAPSPEALRSAIRSHVEAGSFARAATLALEAQRLYPDDEGAMALSGEVIAQHAAELARLHVRCDVPCALVCDGQALGTEVVHELELFLPPGVHIIGARFENGRERDEPLDLAAGELRELSLDAPPAPKAQPSATTASPEIAAPAAREQPATAEQAEPVRLPQPLFWTVAGLTAAAAGLSVWSGLDMLDKHDTYVERPTRSTYDSGVAAETRTNVLLASTAALLAASTALFFFTAWDDGEETLSPSVAATPESAVLLLRRRFQ